MKLWPLIAVAALLSGPPALALTQSEMQEQTVLHAKPQDLLRDYALAACLGAAIPQIAPQTSAAANGYIQYGASPIEAYQDVTKAAQAFLKRDYVSQTGADLSVMKCVDFVHSRSLDAIVAKYFPSHKRHRRFKNAAG